MDEKYGGAKGPLNVRVWLRLLSCAMTVEKDLRRKFSEQYDTTLPRFDVMAALDRYPGGLTMGRLSRALLVSNGNVTALVRQLHEEGMVDIRPDPEDRRSSIASLSARGRDRFRTLAEAHHRWIAEAFSGLPAESSRDLHRLLAELKTSIAKSRGG
jgi:DNA-binding MarR family transcriptional regulator